MQAIVVAIFFAAALCGADAFQCYNCSLASFTFGGQEIEAGEKGCKDPFNDSSIQLVPCETKCAKSVSVGDTPAVRRWCYDEPSIQCTELENFEILGMTISQYCCSGDKCNAAGIVTFSVMLAVAAAFTALLF